jgi:hypothetical protein
MVVSNGSSLEIQARPVERSSSLGLHYFVQSLDVSARSLGRQFATMGCAEVKSPTRFRQEVASPFV